MNVNTVMYIHNVDINENVSRYKRNKNMLACYNKHLSSYNKWNHNTLAKQADISNGSSTEWIQQV